MPGSGPQSKFARFDCQGVLAEYVTPSIVGGKGLTACNNLIYHRQGSWGKRPGSNTQALPNGATHGTPVSGYRWYRAFPSPLTRSVVYSQGSLFIGTGAGSLNKIGDYGTSGTLNGTALAPQFTSAYDPQAIQGQGADVLIVAGLTIPNGSFGTGTITITGLPGPAPAPGLNMNVSVKNGAQSAITTSNYSILATDNPTSIAQQLVVLLNETAAFLNMVGSGANAPFLGESYVTTPNVVQAPGATANPQAVIHLGALLGGAAQGGLGGNSISYSITFNNTGGGGNLAINAGSNSPITSGTSTANFTGGGTSNFSGLAKYDVDLGEFAGLSYMATNAFTGVASWHDHVWAWGDPNNPNTVFASDINQPEAWTFMIENGGMNPNGTNPNNGGYQIGRGDGDASIQRCVPLGNAFYVLKTSNTYMIEGYDFQAGEYQFSVTPQVSGYGIPSPDCVAVLENELVFWSGRKFMRLAVGAYEPEHIGYTIPLTEGLASAGTQVLVKCIAGDFQVQTSLNNFYGPTNPLNEGTVIYRSLALWAMDLGDGNPDTIVVYDDEQTNAVGQYAWTIWSGWNVGAWVQYGNGPNPSGTDTDKPLAFFIGPNGNNIFQVGANATSDSGAAIPWMAQTGWVDYGSPEILKNAHRLFLNAESTKGANFVATLAPGRIIPAQDQVLPYPTALVPITFQPTIAPHNGEALNDLVQFFVPAIQSNSVLMQLNEDGTSFAQFEMLSWGLDCNPEEAWQP